MQIVWTQDYRQGVNPALVKVWEIRGHKDKDEYRIYAIAGNHELPITDIITQGQAYWAHLALLKAIVAEERFIRMDLLVKGAEAETTPTNKPIVDIGD